MKIRARDLPVDPDNNYYGLTYEQWNELHRGKTVEVDKIQPCLKPYVEKVKKEKNDGD